jgi:hypothetical protein
MDCSSNGKQFSVLGLIECNLTYNIYDITGDGSKLHHEELHHLHSSPNII